MSTPSWRRTPSSSTPRRQSPNLSTTKYDLVLGVYTGKSWVQYSAPRGAATERERERAAKLLSELACTPAAEPAAPAGGGAE